MARKHELVNTMEMIEWTTAIIMQGIAARMTEERFTLIHDGIQGGKREAKVAIALAKALMKELEEQKKS